MGTKLNPGRYDCYASAAPNEPMFILLGRDDRAPALVQMWAAASRGRFGLMCSAFVALAFVAAQRRLEGKLSAAPKVIDAIDCAAAMKAWRARR